MTTTLKKVYIVFDYDSGINDGWYPWLKRELEKQEFQTSVLEMPDSQRPENATWLSHLHQCVVSPDKHTYLVGHGLGCAAILRYLESLPVGRKLGGVVLVGGFVKSIGASALQSFFERPFNFEKIKSHTHRFIVIHSDDDPIVSLQQAELLEKKLKAELIISEKKKHFSGSDTIQLPSVLNSIIEMSK